MGRCEYFSILLVFNGFVMCTMPLGAAANVHKVLKVKNKLL